MKLLVVILYFIGIIIIGIHSSKKNKTSKGFAIGGRKLNAITHHDRQQTWISVITVLEYACACSCSYVCVCACEDCLQSSFVASDKESSSRAL